MPASLIRSRAMITARARSSSLGRDRRWCGAAGGRHHRRGRYLRRPATQTPDRPGDRHRQRDPAAGLHQRPPPCRPDAGAARLAGHAAGAVVRHAHGDAQREPVSRYAVFGVRDDRLRHHHGAASARLGAGAAGRGGGALRRRHPRLPGCRDARVVFVLGARPEPAGVSGRCGVRRQPAAGAARTGAALVRPVPAFARRFLRAVRKHARTAPEQEPDEDPVVAGQFALVLGRGADTVRRDLAQVQRAAAHASAGDRISEGICRAGAATAPRWSTSTASACSGRR